MTKSLHLAATKLENSSFATSLWLSLPPGRLNSANSPYVLDTLEVATSIALRKQVHALVTGPVHKGVINEAGIPFTGHTEFLAQQCEVDLTVMMLATEGLRVALATTHLPLHRVAAAITEDGLTEVLTILHRDLKHKFAIEEPSILVCGLNPHAGESGHLGTEEIDIIEPVLNKLSHQGMNLTGPLPADTLFTEKYLGKTDAVLAMYHDQGLPVLKYKGFGNAANITLGCRSFALLLITAPRWSLPAAVRQILAAYRPPSPPRWT